MSSNLCVDVFRQPCCSRSGLWAGQNRRHRNMSSTAEIRSSGLHRLFPAFPKHGERGGKDGQMNRGHLFPPETNSKTTAA